MDHLDWFTPGSGDAEQEVAHFYRVLAPGGFLLLRSAAKKPWYIDVYVFLLFFLIHHFSRHSTSVYAGASPLFVVTIRVYVSLP